ncbi:MAG: hypothetical protein JJ884_07280 [Maricaulis sp.]|uniref:GumC family protein n=1 Tax=Maricaulis sp. TaxID=1486257 RepID=UPI001B2258E4|nr:hypothetical protein [Maricaulis sp.]MBO6729710.1 hypothetical protein [Maricaulis sp.]MBO6847306.1 hypothetical protein [Maricaulis sp.]MBO6876494.1 hypothetical protein [Maricaulis sp.]
MSRRSYSDAQRGGNETLRGGARSDGLDLFDVIALAWSERGFIVIVFAVLFAIGVAASLTLIKPSFEAQSRLLVLLENNPTPAAAGAGGAFMLDQIMQSESELLGSGAVRRQTVAALGAETILGEPVSGNADGAALRALDSSLTISREPYSSALVASYEAGNADQAALILNAVVDSYLAYRQEILVEAGIETVTERRQQADQAVAEAQSALDAFLATHSLANFVSDKSAAETSVTTLHDRVRTASADRDAARAGAQALENRLNNIPANIELYVENGASTLLLDRRVEREQLLSRYQPGAPPVVAIEREISAIQSLLDAGGAEGLGQRRTGVNPVRQALETELATRRANADQEANRVAVFERQLGEAQGDVSRLRGLEPEYTRLAQDVTAAEETAAGFAAQEAVAAARRSLGPGAADAVRVFDRATPPLRGSSMKKLALMAAFVFAAGVAVFLGLIKGYWRAYIAARRPAQRHAPTQAVNQAAAPRYREPQPVQPVEAPARPDPLGEALVGLPVLARIPDRSA